jgi:hypothetical protein
LSPPDGDHPLREEWFADRGNFWGTVQQLLLCARCGQNEPKRHDEPRHFQQVSSPFLHMLCDSCYDELPENGLRRYASAMTAETQSGSGLQPASAVPNGETPPLHTARGEHND